MQVEDMLVADMLAVDSSFVTFDNCFALLDKSDIENSVEAVGIAVSAAAHRKHLVCLIDFLGYFLVLAAVAYRKHLV